MTRPIPDKWIVLLAEDDENDAFLMRRSFDKSQVVSELQLVTDGNEAVAYLSGEGKYADRTTYPFPHLVILDLKLPLKTGFEVLQWIRDQPEINRLPVIVLTNSVTNPDINKAYELGANSYLLKPPTPESLCELIQKIAAIESSAKN